MTINVADNTPRVSYSVAEGVTQTSFTVSFEFFNEADLNVYVDGTLKTLTTDYTVSGGNGSTGTVTISVTGATGGSTVVITRDIALERTTDFPASGAFQIGSLNTELDKLIAITADLDDKASRALQLTDYDTAVSLVLPDVDTRKGKTLAFNASSGAVEAGPTISDVQTVSAAAADIATLADIEDGTDATDAIQTVAGISSNVTTVAGISGNVTTVAGISSDVTAVAADATDIGTVATNIASVNTVATNINDVIAVANDLNEAISEVETVANDLNEAVSEIDTVATSITNVDTVGTNIANVNTVAGNNANVTTVAGISANVTTVAGISGNVTTVAGISSDVTTVAADGTDIGTVATNIANVNTVAGINSNVTTVAGISGNVTTVSGISSNVTTVAGVSSDVTTVAGQISPTNNVGTVAGIASDVSTVSGVSANVTTVAGNTTNINTVAGISGNVTTVAGISSDVTAVAADATDIGTVATNLAGTDTIGTVATNISNVNTVAGISSNVTTVAGISSDVTAVAADSTDIGTVATNISNVNTVGGSISNVNTVATNISSVNDFADKYRIGASDPTTNNDEGDLFYNTTSDTLKVYTGTAWEQGVTAGSGFLNLTGGTMTGNINFGDNDKAVFGAGSDLQIYHDGSHSRIVENGTGNLSIRASNFNIYNSAGTNPYLIATDGAELNLYHNGSARLTTTATGADITGVLTADGLTVDGDAQFTQTTNLISTDTSDGSDNKRLFIGGGGASPSSSRGGLIGLYGNEYFAGGGVVNIQAGNVSTGYFNVMTGGANRLRIANNGDVSLYDSSGVSQGFYWDASTQRLGLGNTAPEANMHISAGDASIAPSPLANTLFIENNGDAGITIASGTTSQGAIRFADSGGNGRGLIKYDHNGDYMGVAVNGSERLRITSDGSVGIGTASPSSFNSNANNLVVGSGSGSEGITIYGGNESNIFFADGTAGSDAYIGRIEYSHLQNAMKFYINNSEAARFDSSQNLLVGTTDAAVYDNSTASSASNGHNIRADGRADHARYTLVTSAAVLGLNRVGSDGSIAEFRKSGSVVGSIGTTGGHMWFGCDDVGMLFRTNESIRPYNPSTQSERDAAIDLGVGASRFKNAFLSGYVYASGIAGQNDTNTYINLAGSDVMQFFTGGSERARLDASGNLLVNHTATGDWTTTSGAQIRASGLGIFTQSASSAIIANRLSTTGDIVDFRYNGTSEGTISITASGVTYNTTSDIRLKENIEPLVATDKLMAMNPVSYNWKADPDGARSMGFIAQEMQEVMPEAVAVGDDKDAMMSMDYGRITPILVSALQDAHRKIEQLEQRLADMEAK